MARILAPALYSNTVVFKRLYRDVMGNLCGPIFLERTLRKALSENLTVEQQAFVSGILKDKLDIAIIRAQNALRENLHLARPAKRNLLLLQAVMCHQIITGEARRKHNNLILEASHPQRVANNTALFYRKWFHVDPSFDILCMALFHDSFEDNNLTQEQLADLFGKNVASLVQVVTIPKDVRDIEYPMEKLRRKHEFKANSVADFTVGLGLVELQDVLDVLETQARNVWRGDVRIADNGKHSPEWYQMNLWYRYNFLISTSKKLTEIYYNPLLNPEKLKLEDILKATNAARTQFAKVARFYAEVTGVELPPGLAKDIAALHDPIHYVDMAKKGVIAVRSWTNRKTSELVHGTTSLFM